ncbi:transglutaminase [Polaribacter reichenbachii]|uniref:Transglutaminase n=1 Tax=Polaribacter reichenbachii TaxID=996801 RepID=A0A1B8TQ29_9FLAO|nr:transglutaminase family protein [Polaribacter reichenbachii]APZ48146.1 transglutaminase [Polaribacter reichenbachii]AUC20414.1 transglutaminase [Polaribacter reichenbachii]OBY61790.1 transglutaminase [Polaribacter reichenbachii]
MVFSIIHKTIYKYDNNVTYCHNLAILKPKLFAGQRLLDYKLEITPKPTVIKENIDFFGNSVTHFSIEKQHKELIVTAVSKVDRSYELQQNNLSSETYKSITLETALLKLNTLNPESIDAKQFLLDSVLIKNISSTIKDYAKESFKKDRSVFEAANELMKRIFTEFKFDSNFSTIATPIQEVMEAKKGVCQDFAQLAIACVRSIGLPARYVSGYIETLPPPGKEKLVGTDASHAWFSVFIPDFGWVDFDPTNNQIPKDQHIVISYGRDYYDVPPLKGVIYGSGKSIMNVSVDIRPAVI